jgi:Skp family chaperone for outer membrane proteins
MVIKKNGNGESKIDWVKSLIVLAVFSGVILYCMTLSVEANNSSKIAAVNVADLKSQFAEMKTENTKCHDKLEAKLDKLLERVK